MTTHARECEHIGLQPCSPARVSRGKGKRDRGKSGRRGCFHSTDAIYCSNGRRIAKMNILTDSQAFMTTTDVNVFKTYMCLICGFIYDEAAGLPDENIAPGTKWEDVPMNWTCPECGARKEDFEMVEI